MSKINKAIEARKGLMRDWDIDFVLGRDFGNTWYELVDSTNPNNVSDTLFKVNAFLRQVGCTYEVVDYTVNGMTYNWTFKI